MSSMIGGSIVILLLALWVGLAVRSLWKGRKKGGSSCCGDCSHCKGCR